MRDITLGDTFSKQFTTRAFATAIPTTLAGTPALSVLEEGNITPITAGVSVSVDRASVTGLNEATVVATGGNGYEIGKTYSIYISTGTVDSVSVIGEIVETFTVEKAAAHIRLGAPAGASIAADIADLPTVSEFNARTILSASYFDPAADTVVNVTNVATLTGHTPQTGDSFARLGAPAGASISVDIADLPTVSEFNARTLLAAAYFDFTTDLVSSNVTQWNSAVVAVPSVAGVPEVDLTHVVGGLVPTPFTAGIPDVNIAEILDTAPSLTTGDLDVNVVTMAAGVITAAVIGTGAVDADALAADAVDKIRDGILPTQNAAFNNIEFLFVATSDHVTPVTGATGVSGTRSIDGGSFAAVTGTIAEVGNGIYQFDASAADMNGGIITFRFIATGGTPGAPDDRFLTIVTGGAV